MLLGDVSVKYFKGVIVDIQLLFLKITLFFI